MRGGWELKNVTGKIAATLNFGVISVTSELGLDAAKTYDVDRCAKGGNSPCNIATDLTMLEALFGNSISLGRRAASSIRDAVEKIDIHAAYLSRGEMGGEITSLKLGLSDFEHELRKWSDATVLIISVLLSVDRVLGREPAVEVTKSFLEKLAAAGNAPDLGRQPALKSILLNLIQDVAAGGPRRWIRSQADLYNVTTQLKDDETFRSTDVRFEKVTYGMMVSLLWWLYQGIKEDDEGQASQICKTLDCRLHKVVYLLEQFGWPIHAALKDEAGQRFAGARRILFQEHDCGEEVEDLPLLGPKEVEKHGLELPQLGRGIVCKYDNIGKVLRAQIGDAKKLGLNMECGWEEGWKIGTSREVTFKTSPRFCPTVNLGDPTIDAGDAEDLGCDKLLRFIRVRGNIQKYSGRFHRMFNGTRKDYEEINVDTLSKAKFKPKTELEAALVGFSLGYLCGSVFAVARELRIFRKDNDVSDLSEEEMEQRDDVYLSWISDMNKFLYNINRNDKAICFPGTNPGLNLGGCLDVVAACFYGEAERFSSWEVGSMGETCVGRLAGDKVFLLEALVNPTTSLRKNCQVKVLSFLPINVPCNGCFIYSATGFRQESAVTWKNPQTSDLQAKPPTSKVSLSIGPNLIENDRSVMHTMYARKKMVHCASILDALTSRMIWEEETPRRPCQHQGPETQVYKASEDMPVYPISDTDLIDQCGALIAPEKLVEGKERPHYLKAPREGTIVVQVSGDELWRYTAASMYMQSSKYDMLLATGCLACVHESNRCADEYEKVEVVIL